MLTKLILFFELHQPRRLRRPMALSDKTPSDLGKLDVLYFDEPLDREIFMRVANKCYIPALKILLDTAIQSKGFKCSLGLSGLFIEQCSSWQPLILDLIKQLVDLGACELVGQTYYHSLAYLISHKEFKEEVMLHRELVNKHFGVRPTTAENTEFMYDNKVAKLFEELGFKVVLTEGVERVLGWRSPNYLYRAKGSNILLLMRNYRLSDDIGFRFSSRDWPEWPLTADKYAYWLSRVQGDVILIALDFETFGEHHWPETGIHEFLKYLPKEVMKYSGLEFSTPSEAAGALRVADEVDVKEPISWADEERDLSAWIGNEMQRYCLEEVRRLEPLARVGDEGLLRIWRLFTIGDHFHQMSTKGGGAGAVHAYFSHFSSAVEAFSAYSWALTDFGRRLSEALGDEARCYTMLYGKLPQSRAFHFYEGFAKPLGLMITNLSEMREAIQRVDPHSLEFHLGRGDFQRWLREVLKCEELASSLDGLKGQPVKGEALRKIILEELDGVMAQAINRLRIKGWKAFEPQKEG